MTSHVAKEEPELDHFPGTGTSVVILGRVWPENVTALRLDDLSN